MRICFDIETDGFLQESTRMWVMCTQDLGTHEKRSFLEGDLSWIPLLEAADVVVGHNIAGFDLPVLKKLFGYEPKNGIFDTMLVSQILDYRRFGDSGHSLRVWGQSLGILKMDVKDDPEFFTRFSPLMLEYCAKDVEINCRVFRVLEEEVHTKTHKNEKLMTYILAEHYAAMFSSEAARIGWRFDHEAAILLEEKLRGEVEALEKPLEEKLGMKCVPVDKTGDEVLAKSPKWNKDGKYDSHTARWFGVDPWSGFPGEERMVEGDYCRVVFEHMKLSSNCDVKRFLNKNGWAPSEFNWKFENGEKIKMSPKIVEADLELMGENGKLYLDYLTLKSRHSILKGWLDVVKDGRVHPESMCVGTPSMRTRHKVIVNVPTVKAVYGSEFRDLFICDEGRTIVGSDSVGNQARGLAHYLGDEKYTELLLGGDIHAYNRDEANKVLVGMGEEPTVTREAAKKMLYAFLFGAGDAKLWGYATGRPDIGRGKEFKEGFTRNIPGLEVLLNRLNKVFSATKSKGRQGYIPGLAGNKIYVDSKHKLLVYLLQACEKATCSTALMVAVKGMRARGIPYQPLVYYHDEFQVSVPDEFVEETEKICKEAYNIGAQMLGVTIMDGSARHGRSWKETH